MTYSQAEAAELVNAQSSKVEVEGGTIEPAPAQPQEQTLQAPEEIASTFYTLFLSKFNQGLEGLSGKDAKRVLQALVEVPLVRAEHGIRDEQAKNVYMWADNMLKSKVMMELTVLHASGLLDQVPSENKVDNNVEMSDNQVKEN